MHLSTHVGIIINRHSYQDADRFLTLLTPDRGKISCLARGVRTLSSKRGRGLELFTKLQFEIVDHHGRLTLTHTQVLASYSQSKTTLGDISRLFQIGELIDGLLPENEENQAVYELLDTALTHLTHFPTPAYLIRFKLKLLKLLGYENQKITLENPINLDSYLESLLDHPLHPAL